MYTTPDSKLYTVLYFLFLFLETFLCFSSKNFLLLLYGKWSYAKKSFSGNTTDSDIGFKLHFISIFYTIFMKINVYMKEILQLIITCRNSINIFL